MNKYFKYIVMTIFSLGLLFLLCKHIKNKKFRKDQEQIDKMSSELCPYKIGDTE